MSDFVFITFPNRKQHDHFCTITGAGSRISVETAKTITVSLDRDNENALVYALLCGGRIQEKSQWLTADEPKKDNPALSLYHLSIS